MSEDLVSAEQFEEAVSQIEFTSLCSEMHADTIRRYVSQRVKAEREAVVKEIQRWADDEPNSFLPKDGYHTTASHVLLAVAKRLRAGGDDASS